MSGGRGSEPYAFSVVAIEHGNYVADGRRGKEFVCYDSEEDDFSHGDSIGVASFSVDLLPPEAIHPQSRLSLTFELSNTLPSRSEFRGNRESFSVFEGELETEFRWVNLHDRRSGAYVGETHYDEDGYLPTTFGWLEEHLYVAVHAIYDREFNMVQRQLPTDVDRTSGNVRTRWNVGRAGPMSRPSVTPDTVYIGTLNEILALDSASGEFRWTTSLRQAPSQMDPVRPTAHSGTVYLCDAEGTVYALDAVTGEKRWTASISSGPTAAPTVLPAEGGEKVSHDSTATVVFVTRDRRIHALDSEEGEQIWTVEIDSRQMDSPVGDGNWLYTCLDDWDLYRIACDSGQRELVMTGWFSPYLVSDRESLYVVSGGNQLVAINLTRGEEVWRFVTSCKGKIHRNPVIVDETVIVANNTGSVHGIDATTGDEIWKKERFPNTLNVVGNTVYTTAGHHVCALDAHTGTVQWRYRTGLGDLTATADGVYAVGENEDGTQTLYALEEPHE
ncbi:PQQ-binding-like beta-propeller repeat protein [Haloarchaeobius sp. DFWS5]|uniref:outer membrane protein assembly factor BamB family protein n=1 Tax=Haloarchaeobius sp. DFWS5 TaxID=3446114 RepID=UPI003EBD5B36